MTDNDVRELISGRATTFGRVGGPGLDAGDP